MPDSYGIKDNLLRSIKVAASGLKAQAGRMRVISENLANSNSTAPAPGLDPYRRKVATFQSHLDDEVGAEVVKLGNIQRDMSPFRTRYEPGNPAADAAGNVRMPNVDPLIEQMDMKQATRSYEASLGVITTTRRMIARTLDILRG